MRRLITIIILLCSFWLHAQQVQIIQTQIDSLLNVRGVDRENFYPDDAPLPHQWTRYAATHYFECFGDICSEARYGLVNDNDTLAAAFLSIESFGDNFLLRTARWSAVVSSKLRVLRGSSYMEKLSDDLLTWGSEDRIVVMNASLEILTHLPGDKVQLVELSNYGDGKREVYFIVRRAGHWGVADSTGALMIPFQYSNMYHLSGRKLAAKKEKYGLVALNGTALTPFEFDSLFYAYDFNGFRFLKKEKVGIIDNNGKMLVAPLYDGINKQTFGGCWCANKNGRWGFIGSDGKEISEFIYTSVKTYHTDIQPVMYNGKWGFFGCEQRKAITPFLYDRVEAFFGHEADVWQNGQKKRIKLKDD